MCLLKLWEDTCLAFPVMRVLITILREEQVVGILDAVFALTTDV